jgi:hypothetical protein
VSIDEYPYRSELGSAITDRVIVRWSNTYLTLNIRSAEG